METTLLTKPRWLTEKAVSELTGISVSTLQKQRFYRRGIPYSKIGRSSIRYSLQDVIDFMETCKVNTKPAT